MTLLKCHTVVQRSMCDATVVNWVMLHCVHNIIIIYTVYSLGQCMQLVTSSSITFNKMCEQMQAGNSMRNTIALYVGSLQIVRACF